MMELIQFAAVALVLTGLAIVALLAIAVTRLGGIAATLREQERLMRLGSREAFDEQPARTTRKRTPPASPIQGFE